MANFDVNGVYTLYAGGSAAERTMSLTLFASPSLPADTYTIRLYYYNSYGTEVTVDTHSYSISGGSTYSPLMPTFSSSELRSMKSGKYTGVLYADITTVNNGSTNWGTEVIDRSDVDPTISASLTYSNRLTVSGVDYGIQTKTSATVNMSGCTAGTYPITDYNAYFDSQPSAPSTVSGTTVTTAAISTYGTKRIVFCAYAGGKWFTSYSDPIEVLPYSVPGVVKSSGQTAIVCERSASDGTYSALGKYLKLVCDKSYAPLTVGGTDRNTALLEACIAEGSGAYGAYFTVSSRSAPDAVYYVSSSELLTNMQSTYSLKLRVTDRFSTVVTVIRIPAASVPLHLKAGGRSVGFGQIASSDNDVIDFGWKVRFNGGAGKTIYSGSAKTRYATITASEGNLENIEKFSLFLVSGMLMWRVDTSTGFNFRSTSTTQAMTYNSQNNVITISSSSVTVTEIIGLL